MIEYDPTGSVIATNVVHVRRLTSGLLVAVRDIPITSGASAFAVADLDGDGKGDLAVARPGATSIDLYTTAEHGTVQYSGQITLEAPTAITAADVDGDGRADLVVGHSLGGQAAMTIMRQQCVPI